MISRISVNEFIFLVIYLKAMYVTSQNDRSTEILSGQIVILTGHCPITGRYFEHCILGLWPGIFLLICYEWH